MIIILNSSEKYFVTQKECKGNPKLHFHVKAKHFCIIDSYMYANNNKIGSYCCVYMATVVRRTRRKLTLHYIIYIIFS